MAEDYTLKDVKSGIEDIAKAHQALVSTLEQYKTENKGEMDALVKAQIKVIADDVAAKHEAVQREFDAIKARESKPVLDLDEAKFDRNTSIFFAKMRGSAQMDHVKRGNEQGFPEFTPEAVDYKKYNRAFWKAVRNTTMAGAKDISMSSLSPEEQKDMAVGSDPDGGYFLAPPTIAQAVVQRVFETSPIREIAGSVTIGTRDYEVPMDPSDVGVAWVAERQTRTTTQTVNPSRKVIPAQEEYAEPAITQQLLEDSMFDLEKYLIDRLSDKFNRNENTAFVNGSGVGQPRGFMTYNTLDVNGGNWYPWGNTLEQINSGQAGTFTYTGLVKLITSLKENFQANACFLTQRQSVWGIMTITDSNGRLIFQPILNGNFNNTPLLGYPLRYATDMPSLLTSAGSPTTAVNAMAFGDFRQGYQIVDRVGLSMIRDNITSKGNVLLYTRKRCGGDVVNFDAIKIHSLQ